jgi:hypothetical protein
LRPTALAVVAALGLTGAGCSIFGEYETTSVKTEDGKTEVSSSRGGGALRCGLDRTGEFPCRAVTDRPSAIEPQSPPE